MEEPCTSLEHSGIHSFEAMDSLGIPTTRALSLIRSEGGDVSNRPWYSVSMEKQVSKQLNEVTTDDPRLARFDVSEREAIVSRGGSKARSGYDDSRTQRYYNARCSIFSARWTFGFILASRFKTRRESITKTRARNARQTLLFS